MHGYRAGNGTAAFYPLYPLLSRMVSTLLLGHIVAAELVVSSVAYLGALWLLYRLARLDVSPLGSRLTVLLVALFPFGFFFLAPFTESLFLLLTVACFWLGRRGRFWEAGLAGFCAGLTRAQGGILVLPLAFMYLRQREAEGERPGAGLLAATLPPLGLIVTTAYLRLVVGERHTGLAAQSGWGYQIVAPWTAIAASWNHISATGDVIELLNLISLLAFVLLAIWVTRRLPLEYSLYVWPSLAILLTREMYLSPLMSVGRYVVVMFPCFLVLGRWLARHPGLASGWLVVSVMLQVLLFTAFIHFDFVG